MSPTGAARGAAEGLGPGRAGRGAVGALARVTQGAELLEVLGGGRGQAAVRAGFDPVG